MSSPVSDFLSRSGVLDADGASEFGRLYSRFLAQTDGEGGAHASPAWAWHALSPPPAARVVDSASLALPSGAGAGAPLVAELLAKVALVKLNGGEGATMGCTGPKSAIAVRGGATFLDLIVRQVESTNQQFGADVPLLLMNSFRTHAATVRHLRRYASHHVSISCFTQSVFPLLDAEALTPLAVAPPPADLSERGGGGRVGHVRTRRGVSRLGQERRAGRAAGTRPRLYHDI